jgi:DivIVA domain-containing protein
VAISFSRPDPSSPASVADATFGTARRGFDQQEVRDFLRMVAAELARLQERERFLERELRAAQAAPVPTEGLSLDDETATRLLGEEAARVLQAAREGGASIRARAEDGAAQLLREAGDEARRLREEAELEASRRRSDAAADAEAELAMAKQQGREMVEEARAYRERVLGELSRRRELARQQIEQLVHGRDRLLQAFERARLDAVDVVAELTPLGGPDEYVDLTPTTGPVPIMVPAASLGDRSSVDDVVPRDGNDPEPAVAEPADEAEPAPSEEPVAEETEPDVEVATEAEDVSSGEEATDEDRPHATVVPFPAAPEPEPEDGIAEERADRDELEDVDDDDVTATDVDALFAKLRANPPVMPEDELDAADAEPATETGEETPFQRRDAAVVPLIEAAARALERVLADEQNDVLDTLRRREPVRDVDALVPPLADQASRYSDAITVELIAAAVGGAASTGAPAAIDLGPDGPLAAVRELVAADLIGPLRERLDRSVADGDGVNEAITKRARSVYREWKTQRIDEVLDDVVRLAFCQGAYAALGDGTLVTWEVDPDGPPSPDCEDNNLAGPVPLGEAFPSGHVSPPMHPGCRCLLVRADR